MNEHFSLSNTTSSDEREEALVEIARVLEGTAREALIEGDKNFAAFSLNMAEAIRSNADEIARNNVEGALQILEQASLMVSHFNKANPHRIVSYTIN